MAVKAAGIILYRKTNGSLEVLLVHPGGPFWRNKDEGFWSLPKGRAENGEENDELLAVAKREFEEETGFSAPEGPYVFVGEAVRDKDKKSVRAWACEGDLDAANIKSNLIEVEWPPKTGKKIEVPEIDRGMFVGLEEAKRKISAYMVPILEQFEKLVQ